MERTQNIATGLFQKSDIPSVSTVHDIGSSQEMTEEEFSALFALGHWFYVLEDMVDIIRFR